MENTGTELHEVVLWRINDDTTESAEELLAIEDEEELLTKVTPTGAAFAFPGETGFGTGDLEPGSYLAVCQIPEGLTPDVVEQFPGPDATAAPGSTLPSSAHPTTPSAWWPSSPSPNATRSHAHDDDIVVSCSAPGALDSS